MSKFPDLTKKKNQLNPRYEKAFKRNTFVVLDFPRVPVISSFFPFSKLWQGIKAQGLIVLADLYNWRYELLHKGQLEQGRLVVMG